GLGSGLIHIAVIGHIVLAGIGFGAGAELLTVLKLLVLDLDNLGRVLPRTKLFGNMFGQQVLGFLTIRLIELVARFELGESRARQHEESRGSQARDRPPHYARALHIGILHNVRRIVARVSTMWWRGECGWGPAHKRTA